MADNALLAPSTPNSASEELAPTPEPRQFQRKLTLADYAGYAVILLLILIWLFGLDGSMPLLGGMPQ